MIRNTHKIGIVIAAYGNESNTKNLILSILKSTYKNFEIVIVDPTKISPTFKKFIASCKRVFILNPHKDMGYGGSCNTGVRFLLKRQVDYLMIMNNDLEIDRLCLENLIAYLENSSKEEAIGPRIYSFNNKDLYQEFGSYVNILMAKTITKWSHEKTGNNLSITPYGVKKLPGACMFLKANLFKKIGFFDNSFFLYFVDTDWAKRVEKMNIKMTIIPDAKAYHKISNTTSKINGLVEFYTTRDFLFFIKKHYSFPVVIYCLLISIIRFLSNIRLYKKKKIFRYVVLGYWHFIINKHGKYDFV